MLLFYCCFILGQTLTTIIGDPSELDMPPANVIGEPPYQRVVGIGAASPDL